MATFVSGGLETRTVAEIKEIIEGIQTADISDVLDQSSTSPLGQFNAIIANQLATVEEALANLYSIIDPDSAWGDALNRLSAITGTTRRPGRATTISASLFFDQTGTFPAGSLLANPVGSTISFANDQTLVVSAVPHTASNVLMRASITGSVQVVAGPSGPLSLTQIASPSPGWTKIEGTGTIIIGQAAETDAELRARRTEELFSQGTTSTAGITSRVRQIDGVISCITLDNTGSVTIDNIPPYGVETVVWGGFDNTEVAQTIYEAKSAGTPTSGNTEVVITDTSGYNHRIRFTIPVAVPVTLDITIGYQAGGAYGGDQAVKERIMERALQYWVPGRDVVPSQIISWIMSVGGVLEVSAIDINSNPTKLEIDGREIAEIQSINDITITSSPVTP
jgi:uncharacterized phage protein gp47/JayE